jgi:hypothetical protein
MPSTEAGPWRPRQPGPRRPVHADPWRPEQPGPCRKAQAGPWRPMEPGSGRQHYQGKGGQFHKKTPQVGEHFKGHQPPLCFFQINCFQKPTINPGVGVPQSPPSLALSSHLVNERGSGATDPPPTLTLQSFSSLGPRRGTAPAFQMPKGWQHTKGFANPPKGILAAAPGEGPQRPARLGRTNRGMPQHMPRTPKGLGLSLNGVQIFSTFGSRDFRSSSTSTRQGASPPQFACTPPHKAILWKK